MGDDYNELLAAQYNDGIRALLGLEEQEGVTSVAPEFSPIIDLFGRIENWRLFGGFPLGGTIEQAAVAAEFGFITFRNPVASGMLVTIEHLVLSNIGANAVRVGSRLSNGFLAGAATVPVRLLDRGRADPATGDNQLLPFLMVRGSQTADPIAEQYARLATLEPVPVNHVLPPGVELIVITDAVNQALGLTCLGRARRSQPRERVV